jgi:hypothetical protein
LWRAEERILDQRLDGTAVAPRSEHDVLSRNTRDPVPSEGW